MLHAGAQRMRACRHPLPRRPCSSLQVLAKTLLLDDSTRFRYSYYKSDGGSATEAIAMRIRVFSPAMGKQANFIWVRTAGLPGVLPSRFVPGRTAVSCTHVRRLPPAAGACLQSGLPADSPEDLGECRVWQRRRGVAVWQ